MTIAVLPGPVNGPQSSCTICWRWNLSGSQRYGFPRRAAVAREHGAAAVALFPLPGSARLTADELGSAARVTTKAAMPSTSRRKDKPRAKGRSLRIAGRPSQIALRMYMAGSRLLATMRRLQALIPWINQALGMWFTNAITSVRRVRPASQ
jgi:hypothetical protein